MYFRRIVCGVEHMTWHSLVLLISDQLRRLSLSRVGFLVALRFLTHDNHKIRLGRDTGENYFMSGDETKFHKNNITLLFT